MFRACWSCNKDVGFFLMCESCGKVQPPMDFSPFERLGFEPHPIIDQEALFEKYFTLQEAFHPDRFVGKSKEEQRYAQQHSEAFNNAFSILKDPVKCLEALLEGEQSPPDEPEVLSRIMELYEVLNEISDEEDLLDLEEQVTAQSDLMLALCLDAFERNQKQDLLTHFKHLQYFEKILATLKEKTLQYS